jgi:hypothetical protein
LRGLSVSCICLLAALAALIGPGVAAAEVNLGSVVPPTGSTLIPCAPEEAEHTAFVQLTAEPATPYTVPAGDWKLMRWEVNTIAATPGAAVTLLALRPAQGGSYEVLATDTESLPDPLPPGEVASFALARPIAVSGGETLGLYAAAPQVTCFFKGGETPTADVVDILEAPTAPMPGQTLPLFATSEHRFRLNLAATLRQDPDVAVATAAYPADATVGSLAVLAATVTDHGPEASAVEFTDTVPAGLRVESAVVGPGSCTTAGQTVSCAIEGLAVGESAPVTIMVTPTAPGSYLNAVSVVPGEGLVDHSPADDTASARLEVAPAPPATITGRIPTPPTGTNQPPRPAIRACLVPNLRRVPPATARHLLRRLGCTAGKSRHVHNRKVPRGTVVRTAPKPGTYGARRKVGLVVSWGPPRQHHHRGAHR